MFFFQKNSVSKDEAGVPACTLVDRSLSCFKVDCDAALGDAICKGTVLDGELVHNLQMNRPVFMVFDILAYGDTSLTQHNFQDRFSVVTDKVCTTMVCPASKTTLL